MALECQKSPFPITKPFLIPKSCLYYPSLFLYHFTTQIYVLLLLFKLYIVFCLASWVRFLCTAVLTYMLFIFTDA